MYHMRINNDWGIWYCFSFNQADADLFQVQGWLDQLFAGSRVPEYEHNEQTIDILYQLMQRNRACDRDTQLLIQDLQQKAKEYASEGM